MGPDPAPGVHVRTRPATPDDARFVWVTNNHPSVRAQAIHTADIPWQDHTLWYSQRLAREDCRLVIAVAGDQDVGVARFDVADGEAVITIAVSPEHRARGIGKQLVGLITSQALSRDDVAVVVAYVHPGNVASRRVFLDNHYLEAGDVEIAGRPMVRFERRREQP